MCGVNGLMARKSRRSASEVEGPGHDRFVPGPQGPGGAVDGLADYLRLAATRTFSGGLDQREVIFVGVNVGPLQSDD